MRTRRTSPFPENHSLPHKAGLALAAATLLLSAALAGVAGAALRGIDTTPAEPTTCDAVGLIVKGDTPDPCYEVIGGEIFGPEPLPTMGPIPAYGIRVRIYVREPNPLSDVACPLVITPYEQAFRLGRLEPGIYYVNAVEILKSYTYDDTGDSSQLWDSFSVRPDSCTDRSCYMLGFGPDPSIGPMRLGCTVFARPGGAACITVTLHNDVPVGGVETEVLLTTDGSQPLPEGWFTATGVEPWPRAEGFEAAWIAQGSNVKVVLFSATAQTIAPGRGPIFHICYSVADSVPVGSSYLLHFGPSVVADAAGNAIPHCPTFVETMGRICIGSQGCDLNGDGISDVRDVIRLVRCILAGTNGEGACPDSIVARADCNGDGHLDIRDVICCVHRILGERLGMGPGGDPGADPGTNGGTNETTARFRFLGPVTWTEDGSGRAVLEIEPGTDFGGTLFRIRADQSPARIRALRLLEGADALSLESMIDAAGGMAAAMLYPVRLDAAVDSRIRVEIEVEPRADATEAGLLRIDGATSAGSTGDAIGTDLAGATAAVPARPAAAPRLYAPRPNPFAAGSEIRYALPAEARVSLRVYDVQGRLARTLENGTRPAGIHRVHWDGADEGGRAVGTGVYFLRLEADGVVRTARIVRTR